MSNIIDARGRSCPEPVILTKNALEKDQSGLKIIVDSNVAVENITRFAESKGYNVNVKDNEEDFEITIKKQVDQ